MRKFITLTVENTDEQLVMLLNSMKESRKKDFFCDIEKSAEYSKNVFIPLDKVGCFRTNDTDLFKSWVWVYINRGKLTVANITSELCSVLGVERYNRVINSFFQGFLSLFIDRSYHVYMSGEYVSMEELIDERAYHYLNSWERIVNKSCPFGHPEDDELWYSFLGAMHRSRRLLPVQDLSQWLFEDKGWPSGYSDIIDDICSKYEYSLDLLDHYDHQDR